MVEHPEENSSEPRISVRHELVRNAGSASETPVPHAAYFKLIDKVRKALAVAMAVCSVGYVVCSNRDDYLRLTLRRESGIWAWGCWGFGIGVLACLTVTLALIVEHLARPAKPTPFTLRSLFVRSLLILISIVAICVSMAFAYGPGQAIGAVVGSFLLLAAVRERHMSRAILAGLAAIVLGLTLLGTQSAYQYARWHADEIVAAGCVLADHCPRTGYHTRTFKMFALFGQQIDPSDPRVPSVLRKLGAQRIWVDDDRVAVYVGADTEFQMSYGQKSRTRYKWREELAF